MSQSGFYSQPSLHYTLTSLRGRHSDKNSAAINRYLDFAQTRGLIPLVNDNHVENMFAEILAFVYYGSIENDQPKTRKRRAAVAEISPRNGQQQNCCGKIYS